MEFERRSGPPRYLSASPSGGPTGLAAFTTRHGGVSRGAYSSLNLAFHVGDDPASVLANRGSAAEALGVSAERMTFVRQVHGTDVAVIGAREVGAGSDGPSPLVADALVTAEREATLGVLVADCAAVLVADEHRRAIAAVHAGWRGTYEGVLPAALGVMVDRFGVDAADLRIWVGPHARACCYEVSDELASRFEERFGPAARPADAGSRVDLEACLAAQWRRAGVADTQVESVPHCTICGADMFFSHRAAQRASPGGADEAVTGRFAGLISLAP